MAATTAGSPTLAMSPLTRSSAPWMNSAVPSANHRLLLVMSCQLVARAITACTISWAMMRSL